MGNDLGIEEIRKEYNLIMKRVDSILKQQNCDDENCMRLIIDNRRLLGLSQYPVLASGRNIEGNLLHEIGSLHLDITQYLWRVRPDWLGLSDKI